MASFQTEIELDAKLGRLYRYLVVNISLTYIMAAVFYAEQFHFWQHALSELGTTRTLLGTPNLTSATIVIIGMFINGRLLLELARTYYQHPGAINNRTKGILLYLSSLGAFVNIIPNNLFHTIHTIGSAFLIGGIFLLDIQILRERIASEKTLSPYLLAGTLTLSVGAYAVAYFTQMPIVQAIQKICVVDLLLVFYERSCSLLRLANPSVYPKPS